MKNRILLLALSFGILCGCSQEIGSVGTSAGMNPGVSAESVSDGKSENLRVHYIDIGQGDATLIQSGNHAMLIDAGENDKGTLVQNYIQKQGITSLDYVVGTHPHSDHIGGLDVIITKFDVGHVLLPKKENDTRTYDDVIQAMKYKHITPEYPAIGEQFSLGDAQVTVLGPGEHDYGNEMNNYSLAVLIEYGNDRFLFTGDAETEAESDIVATGIDISADVYQAGHHGSRTSSSEPLLEAVKPAYVVISCGENNEYGHPHAEPMNQFRARKIEVYRTDEEGTIIATSNGNGIQFSDPPSDTWLSGEGTINSQKTDNKSTKTEKSGTYIINLNSKKFHLPTCGSIDQISDKNKKEVTEKRESLIKQGYTPCGNCNP